MAAEDPPIAPGDVLDGKYAVERVLGQGGMGIVVAARHKVLGTDVAVKVLLDKADDYTIARFHREARTSVRLRSPHTARVHDVGTLPDGRPYMVMDLLVGRDLSSLLKERGALPVEDAVRYVIQALQALDEAHAIGLVHRDLKPANLFLADQPGMPPVLKVLDFGIAKDFHDIRDKRLTHTTAVIGSPAYMSPEQSREAREADVRSDIWSIGVTLYELLTNDHPFMAETLPDLFVAILAGTPTPPDAKRPDLPAGLGDIVLRCIEKDPARRFQTARDLAAALMPYSSRASWPSVRALAPAPRMGPLTPQRVPVMSATAVPMSATRVDPRRASVPEVPISSTIGGGAPAGGGSRVAAALIGVAVAGLALGGVAIAKAKLKPQPPPASLVAPVESAPPPPITPSAATTQAAPPTPEPIPSATVAAPSAKPAEPPRTSPTPRPSHAPAPAPKPSAFDPGKNF